MYTYYGVAPVKTVIKEWQEKLLQATANAINNNNVCHVCNSAVYGYKVHVCGDVPFVLQPLKVCDKTVYTE